jgi:hypothetical protein
MFFEFHFIISRVKALMCLLRIKIRMIMSSCGLNFALLLMMCILPNDYHESTMHLQGYFPHECGVFGVFI